MNPLEPTEREQEYRCVLPLLDRRILTELVMKHVDDAQLRNALVTLIALQSGQTRPQVFNAVADLYALRRIERLQRRWREREDSNG